MYNKVCFNTRIVFLATIVLVYIAASSCGSKSNPQPAPGSLSGSVTPPTAAISVFLNTSTGTQKYAVTPNSDGTFSFPSVMPGGYMLGATPTMFYNTPGQQEVSIASGINTVATISMPYYGFAQPGIINFTLNGTSYTISSPFSSYSSPIFNFTGGTPHTPSYYYLDLKLNSVSATGTYNISNSASYISLFYYTSPGNNAGHWSTNNGGSGAVNITTFDTTTRTASGAFSAILVPQDTSVATKVISGSFNLLY